MVPVALVAHVGLALALAAVIFVGVQYGRGEAVRLGLTLVSLLTMVLLIQEVVARPRPAGLDYRVMGIPFHSFPSGHAAVAFASATFVALRARGWSTAWLLVAFAVAAVRVAGGVHYPSDVVAGSALGAGFAVTGYGIWRRDEVRPAWAWLGFAWMGMVVTMAAWASAGVASVHTLLFAGADKVLHFLGFGLIGLFAVAWFSGTAVWRTLAIVVALTLVDENLQAFLPGRTVDPLDAVMSVLGVVVFGGWVAVAKGRSMSLHHHRRGMEVT